MQNISFILTSSPARYSNASSFGFAIRKFLCWCVFSARDTLLPQKAKRKIYLAFALLTFTLIAQAQVGIGTTTPSDAAALHLVANNKGLIIPIVDDLAAVDTSYKSDTNTYGLMVYLKPERKFYSWNGTTWQCLNPIDAAQGATNINVANTFDTLEGNFKGSFTGYGATPVGGIIMWSGAVNTVPDGWALCDGRLVSGLRTPDLRGRFIVGYGSDRLSHNGSGAVPLEVWDQDYTSPGNRSVGGTTQGYRGNNDTAFVISANNLPEHWHTGNSNGNNDGRHNHMYRDSYMAEQVGSNATDVQNFSTNNSDRIIGIAEPLGDGVTWWYGSAGGFDADNNALLTIYRTTYAQSQFDWSGTRTPYGAELVQESLPADAWRTDEQHHHTILTNTTKTGSNADSPNTTNADIDNRPPYYVLAFIMRVR